LSLISISLYIGLGLWMFIQIRRQLAQPSWTVEYRRWVYAGQFGVLLILLCGMLLRLFQDYHGAITFVQSTWGLRRLLLIFSVDGKLANVGCGIFIVALFAQNTLEKRGRKFKPVAIVVDGVDEGAWPPAPKS